MIEAIGIGTLFSVSERVPILNKHNHKQNSSFGG